MWCEKSFYLKMLRYRAAFGAVTGILTSWRRVKMEHFLKKLGTGLFPQ